MQTSACLVHEHQSQHRDILEDWPWTKWEHRRTRLVHNSSLAHQTLTCPSARLYLTSSDAIEVLFLQAISLLWAPFLLFSGVGRYLLKWDPWGPPLMFISGLPLHPVLFGSYKATILCPQKITPILLQCITLWYLIELQCITTEVEENDLPTFSMKYVNSVYINQGTTN